MKSVLRNSKCLPSALRSTATGRDSKIKKNMFSKKVLAASIGATVGIAALVYLYSPTTSTSSSSSAVSASDELARVKAELAAVKRELRDNSNSSNSNSNSNSNSSTPGSPDSADIIKPPLPFHVVRLLEASQLCFLSTSHNNDPHLSLMNFTYYQKDELVIMCTKRDTKKFRQIIKSNTVALLIHDFPRAFASFLFLLFSLYLCVVVVVVVVVHLNLNLNLISFFFFNFFFNLISYLFTLACHFLLLQI